MELSMVDDFLLRYLSGLSLLRLGEEESARLSISSLPVPRYAGETWSLGGHPTNTIPLGKWPGAPSPAPRRLLLGADTDGVAPSLLQLTEGNTAPIAPPPTAEMVTFAHAITVTSYILTLCPYALLAINRSFPFIVLSRPVCYTEGRLANDYSVKYLQHDLYY